MLAHRAAWVAEHGPIPLDMCVCHRCDNPPCVNPAHLFLGTKADNSADMVAKGRHGRSAPRGIAHYRARLTVDQVVAIRAAVGSLTEIGRQFGIDFRQVHKIKKRTAYASIP